MRKTFRLVLEGKASNGGFAIDQLTFNPGDCPSETSPSFIVKTSVSCSRPDP